MTAKPTPKARPVSDPVWRALEGVHGRVSRIEHALAPAFSPRKDDTMSRRPGDHRPEPFIMRQASSNSDPWAGDLEHSPQFMRAIMDGTPISELRRRSADDAVMRARRDQASPVMWRTLDGTPVMDGSVTTAPEQQSVEHRQWSDFPDHQPLPEPPPTGQEPGFLTARRHAGQLPARPPERPVVRGL